MTRRGLILASLAVALTALTATGRSRAFSALSTSETPTAPPSSKVQAEPPRSFVRLGAPLPQPLFKTHFNSGTGKYVFKDRAWDLAQLRHAFNAVIVRYGDQELVEAVRAAGLAAVVEFDKKDDFVRTGIIGPVVVEVIRQVKSNPGTIAAIRVADRVNQKIAPEQAIAYLQATGGVFHKEIPGVPIVVDVEDWELTCGSPGQSSCKAHKDDEYKFCTNEVLLQIYRSGYVDGFELAVNLKNDDADVMGKAIIKARGLVPPPFLLYARTASLSFASEKYPGDSSTARRQVAAYIEAPLNAGADGIDLWAWHRPWKAELRTFLDKGGIGNALWREMTRAYAAATASHAAVER